MKVKLGHLPGACRLTGSYQKHLSLHRFKEIQCKCDSLTFRCRLSLPSTFCHQQTQRPISPCQLFNRPTCCLSCVVRMPAFSSVGNVFLIIYSVFMYHEDISFYQIGCNAKHLVLLLNMFITFVIVMLLLCNIIFIFFYVN